MESKGKPTLVVRQGISKEKERKNKRERKERKERKEKEAKRKERKERKERENKKERTSSFFYKKEEETRWGGPQRDFSEKTDEERVKAALKRKHFLAAPKKPAHVPSTIRPYIDLWTKYGGTKHLDEYTKSFKNGVRLLKRLTKGTAFNKSDYRNSWGNRKFTYEEFELSVKRLHLAITSEFHHPKNKKSIKSTSLSDFILHGYGKNGDFSLFLFYLENPPRRYFPEKDEMLTRLLIAYYRDNLLGGIEYIPPRDSKDKFILASNKLRDFFEKHRQKISPGFIIDKPRMVRWLFEAVQASLNGFKDASITPGHLCSDLTFNQRLPTFLTKQAIFKDRHTII